MISLDFTGPAQDVNPTSCLVGDIAFDTYSDHYIYIYSVLCVLPTCTHVNHICTWYLQKSENGFWSHGTGIINDCKLPYMSREWKQHFLCEYQVLLTTISPAPYNSHLKAQCIIFTPLIWIIWLSISVFKVLTSPNDKFSLSSSSFDPAQIQCKYFHLCCHLIIT